MKKSARARMLGQQWREVSPGRWWLELVGVDKPPLMEVWASRWEASVDLTVFYNGVHPNDDDVGENSGTVLVGDVRDLIAALQAWVEVAGYSTKASDVVS